MYVWVCVCVCVRSYILTCIYVWRQTTYTYAYIDVFIGPSHIVGSRMG